MHKPLLTITVADLIKFASGLALAAVLHPIITSLVAETLPAGDVRTGITWLVLSMTALVPLLATAEEKGRHHG